MTGETQLRARRTRIKILRAITEKNGSASFSEIRDATGLSTGSIYYHLQRMSNYINKDSRHYIITKEGMQMFRQIEGGSPPVASNDDEENTSGPAITFPSDSLRLADPQRNGLREYAFVLSLIGVSMFLVYNLFTSSHIIFPSISAAGKMIANASLISSASIAALLSISFLIMIKRHLLPTGYRGIMLSALTVLSVLLVNILIFSGLGTQIGVSSGISAAGKMIANASLISSASIVCASFNFISYHDKETFASNWV